MSVELHDETDDRQERFAALQKSIKIYRKFRIERAAIRRVPTATRTDIEGFDRPNRHAA